MSITKLWTRFKETETDFPKIRNLKIGTIHYKIDDDETWFMFSDICEVLHLEPLESINCVSKKNSNVFMKQKNNYSETFINLAGFDEVTDFLTEEELQNAEQIREALVLLSNNYVKKNKLEKAPKSGSKNNSDNISECLRKIRSISDKKDSEIKKLKQEVYELRKAVESYEEKNNALSDDVRNAILNYYQASKKHTYVKTANHFGVGTTTVYRILAEHKLIS